MAGIHFVILKVNGVDVSQMPHEEAVQMFLKASEPIVVEVRRQSYNVDSVESADGAAKTLPKDIPKQKESANSRGQSPIITQLTSPAKHNKLPSETSTIAETLKFNSLVISPSQGPLLLDSSTTTSKNNNTSASTSSPYSCNNQMPHTNESSIHLTNTQSRSASVSSTTSPTKSLHQHSAASSPFNETRTIPIAVEGGQQKIGNEDVLSIGNKGLVSIGIQTDNFTTDYIFSGSEQIIENDHNLFSECIAPEIDIEEITLRKSDSNERLGLTVSYSSGGGNGSGSDDTDTCTEVYISDIVPDSIAGRDGRLRQGDQILQVNGKDVSNKEETETLIAENNNAVTLLVSRYLYGEYDEFNEQGDFFDDDEQNMEYANCFLGNYILSEDLTKPVKISSETAPSEKNAPIDDEDLPTPKEVALLPTTTADVITTTTSSSSCRDPLNHQSIRAHLDQVNQEIAILDSRVENMMLSQHAKPLRIEPAAVVQKPKEAQCSTNVAHVMDYDTEHIYETIPEDSESEPFYCSPYESSEHQNRIELWLGIHQEESEVTENRMRSLQHKQQQNTQQNQDNLVVWSKARNGTIRSTNSSAGDDHENSSSAYNTGGSCNSNTMTPLTLELNSNYRDREQHSTSTLILCSSKQVVSPIHETTVQHRLPQELTDSAKSLNRRSNEKLISPTPSKVAQIVSSKQNKLSVSQKNDTKSSLQNTPISATNTMYTNVANLQQTMLLQQQLFRQALIHQKVPSNSVPCPQFTAPNLSQYHFVSSQEVSTVQLNTHPHEEHMVWKVKRRQDGTRYIVRRPARNRLLRNRAMRITAERNDQTTEDDTISEIKTGRYWTKEERKKHMERARERRQRQQIIIANKNNEISPPNPEANPTQRNSNPDMPQQSNQLKSQHTLPTTAAKVYRHNTATTGGQSFYKKLVKKINNSPVVEVSQSLIPANTTTGTIKSTTTPSGSKMLQCVPPDNSSHSRVIHPPQ